jgi:hypothetical protein
MGWLTLLFQIELEGRSYDDFVVPACPTCQLEGREERTVRLVMHS